MRRRGSHGLTFQFNVKAIGQQLDKLIRCEAVQVLNYPVVIQDFHLVVGKKYSHEVVVPATVFRLAPAGIPQLLPYQRPGGSAVVAVGYINLWNFFSK